MKKLILALSFISAASQANAREIPSGIYADEYMAVLCLKDSGDILHQAVYVEHYDRSIGVVFREIKQNENGDCERGEQKFIAKEDCNVLVATRAFPNCSSN